MPQDVADYLGVDPQGRHECQLCGSSDGLSIDPEQGDTGSAHCFSCGFGEGSERGTGAQLYAEVEGVTISEALDAFGVESSDLSTVKQKEQQAPRPRVPEKSDPEWREMHRAWKVMSRNELWLRDQYRRRRALAAHERDRDEFERWHEKYEALHEHVLRREMEGQREADRMDSVSRPNK